VLSICSVEAQEQTAPLNRIAAANAVPFGSKKNTIDLLVQNKGEKRVQTIVVSAYDLPTWIHFTSIAETLQLGMKDKQQVASFEFSVDPNAPVAQVTPIHFLVNAQSGEVWRKDITITPEAPKKFVLLQNYPNPFNPVTTISYDVARETRVSLKIFDLLGRELVTLVDETQKPGHMEKSFDASSYSSGVYFYRIQADNFVAVKKLMLLK
jgi:hypothetical protein